MDRQTVSDGIYVTQNTAGFGVLQGRVMSHGAGDESKRRKDLKLGIRMATAPQEVTEEHPPKTEQFSRCTETNCVFGLSAAVVLAVEKNPRLANRTDPFPTESPISCPFLSGIG
jgi:hypothetical protein